MTNDNKINLINPINKEENLLNKDVYVSGTFGEARGKRLHEGIDYSVVNGSNVFAAAGGRVIKAVTGHDQLGNYVIVRHENGESALYAHLSDISSISYLQQVSQGQKIGESGNTGYIIRNGERVNVGYHLHFEVIDQEGTRVIEASGNSKNTGISGQLHRIDPSKADSNSTPDLASAKESLTTTLSTITVTAQKEAVAKSWFETFSDSLGLWTGSVTNFIKEVSSDVVNFFSSPSESLSKIGGWISSAFTFGESEKTPDPSTINNSNLNLEINTNLTSGFAGNNDLTQTGNVIGDADWRATMPINIINGDGYKNVASSGIVSDGFRPGNSELSSYSNFNTQLNVDFSRLDNLTNQLNQANQSQSIHDISKLNLQLQNPLAQITNNAIKSKLIIFFTLLMCIATESYAEGCKSDFSLYTGCKGEEGYIYIPKDYRQESKISCKNPIFKGNSLPKVGSIVRPTSVLMFYKNLDEINSGYKKCTQSVKDFKGKEFLYKDRVSGKVKSIKEVDDCLMDICMSDFNKRKATGNEDILGWSNNFKIISYEQIKNDLFAKIKITK